MIESKNSKVRSLVAQGLYKEALQICKDWNYDDPRDRDQLRLGYECMMYPEFYSQLGRDTKKEWEKAVAVLIRIY